MMAFLLLLSAELLSTPGEVPDLVLNFVLRHRPGCRRVSRAGIPTFPNLSPEPGSGAESGD